MQNQQLCPTSTDENSEAGIDVDSRINGIQINQQMALLKNIKLIFFIYFLFYVDMAQKKFNKILESQGFGCC